MFPFFPMALGEEAGEAAAEAAAVVEETPSFWTTLVDKFVETPATTWIAVAVIVVLALMLLLFGRTRKQWTARTVAFAALAVALSFVLSLFRLYRMPSGGSITPASMLPVMLFAAAFGVGPGVLAGAVLGVLQYMQGGWFLNVWQFLLDYVLAYAALGLCGLYAHVREKKDWQLFLFMLLATFVRFVSATLAGYMFWDTAFVASMAYNGTYLIPDLAICMVLAVPLHKPVMRVLTTGR